MYFMMTSFSHSSISSTLLSFVLSISLVILLWYDDLDYRSNENWETSRSSSTCQDSNRYVTVVFLTLIIVWVWVWAYRRYRSATGYLPEKDASGKDKWPRGEEKVWREGMRTIDRGEFSTTSVFSSSLTIALKTLQMLIRSPSLLLTTYKHRLLVNVTILVWPVLLILP